MGNIPIAELERTRNHTMQLARACHIQGSTRAAVEYLREARRLALQMFNQQVRGPYGPK